MLSLWDIVAKVLPISKLPFVNICVAFYETIVSILRVLLDACGLHLHLVHSDIDEGYQLNLILRLNPVLIQGKLK